MAKNDYVVMYSKYLRGENLDEIATPEQAEVIRTFSMHRNLSLTQIKEKIPNVGIDTLGALKNIQKRHRTTEKTCAGKLNRNFCLAVKAVLNGAKCKAVIDRYVLSDSDVTVLKKCIRLIKRGTTAPELHKIGVNHSYAVSLLAEWEKIKGKESSVV